MIYNLFIKLPFFVVLVLFSINLIRGNFQRCLNLSAGISAYTITAMTIVYGDIPLPVICMILTCIGIFVTWYFIKCSYKYKTIFAGVQAVLHVTLIICIAWVGN